MKISYQWLRELTGLDWPAEELGDRLTLCGTACEEIEATDRYMDKVVVAEVIDLKPIEGASKIRLATVNIGAEQMDLVCGAPNVAVGQKVPVALLKAKLAGDIVIKKAKIRGVESCGMICSERELGLSDDHSGIWVLEDDAKVGTPLADHLDFHDYQLTFELTPNRPDSMSAIGIARDLAALASIKVKLPQFELQECSVKASDSISVSIEDSDACPRYAARVIKGVKVGPSPWWIRKQLLTAGIRPISNVVDITNYVMIETGHPLHAFDLDRFGSNKVVVRRATDGEKFATLDGQVHELTPDVLMITNGKKGVAAGGVMGGLESEVEDSTTNLLLEAAYFDPSVIRKSRKHLQVVSESSARFEKGADPNGVEFAINRAAYLLSKVCGGEVHAGIVDCYPQKIEPLIVPMRPQRCNSIMGKVVPTERMCQILTDLEFDVSGTDPIKTTVPTFRPDIEREIDLIEEITRIEGFDSIPDATHNIGPLYTPTHKIDAFQHQTRSVLTAAGFDEMIWHGLVDEKIAKLTHPELNVVRITNPSSADLNVMRTSTIQSVLMVIGHNISHRNLNLTLFEQGTAYFPPSGEQDFREEGRLMLAVTGQTDTSWREPGRPFDFFDLKGAIGLLAEHFHWPLPGYKTHRVGFLDDGMSYSISLGDNVVGLVGKVNEKVLKTFGIKQPVFVAELCSESLLKSWQPLTKFEPLPVFPAAPRDLAIVVRQDVAAGELVDRIKRQAGELAESVDIFDVYAGKQIEKGMKSIAVAISYRSPSRSLSGEEVDEKQQSVVAMLKKEFNAEIRDK